MDVKYNKNGIIHIEFPSHKEIGLTMCRLQEFYESPYENLRNKFFTFEEFVSTYTDDDGEFSYFVDWEGYNIPGNVYRDFVVCSGMELTERELVLYETVDRGTSKYFECSIYIIASVKGNDDVRTHEFVHALYYLNNGYYQNVQSLLAQLPRETYQHVYDKLVEGGYVNDKKIIDDEINAYLSTSTKSELKKEFDIIVENEVLKPFKKLAKIYLKKLGI